MLLGATSFWGTQGQTVTPQQNQQRVQATPLPPDIDPSDPALPVWVPKPAATAAKPTPTPTNAQPWQQTGQIPGSEVGAVTKNGDRYTFRSQVNEVTLSAVVLDARRHLVTNLAETNFAVYEDNQPQKITFFKRQDIPVSIGIVVDNSGSMRTKRAAVTKAVLNLIQASNPQDEVFVVNFNDDPYLDQDFTNKMPPLREALDRVDSRGGTALYDAVIASADHLAKGAKKEKKVLLVITDGVDNESRESLESAIRKV
ncbi:MAG: VWA domain-containing protein, partial [Candidatus Angelobacter sp.]